MKKFFFIFTIPLLVILILEARNSIAPLWYLPTKTSATFGASIRNSDLETVASDLQVPWDLVFLPNGEILISERRGNLVRVVPVQKDRRLIPIPSTTQKEEGGLHGLALHPQFQKNQWLYLYKGTTKNGIFTNQVERYHYENGTLTDKTVILDQIPGAKYHDGGRIAFGPDGYLYITTGDASIPELAQDIHSLAGKILRVKDDGTLPEDNPFGNAVYSYGHRNPQGLTWDDSNRLWSTEHGERGEDELNLIERGQNYGWPIIRGSETKEGMKSPILQSGDETWAPASALYYNGSVFFGGLRGEALFEAQINKKPTILIAHFRKELGRIRTVRLGPDGYFYITTSNRDGRGFPERYDDKVIKIHPKVFQRN